MSERKLMAVPDWKQAANETAQEGICREFGLAANSIDPEYGVFTRYNDFADRREHCFLTDCPVAQSLPARYPGKIEGPFPPVIALSGG